MLVNRRKPLLKMFLFGQDEKTIGRLMSDIQETQEFLSKHKAESNVRHNVDIFLKNN